MAGGQIHVYNGTGGTIYVSIGMVKSTDGDPTFFTLEAGQSDHWGGRVGWQRVDVVRQDRSGAKIETYLGIPGTTVEIR